MRDYARMPFGKYRNELLSDVPSDYLRWLVANIELREPLYSAVQQRLRDAERSDGTPPPPPLSRGGATRSPQADRQLIDRWFAHLDAVFGVSSDYSDEAVVVIEYARRRLEIELGLISENDNGGGGDPRFAGYATGEDLPF